MSYSKYVTTMRHIVAYGKNTGCKDCGKYADLTYDHLPERGPKEFTIGNAAIEAIVTIEALKAEIAKCEVVCETCHRSRERARLAVAIPATEVFYVLAALSGETSYAHGSINKVFRVLRILSGETKHPSWS